MQNRKNWIVVFSAAVCLLLIVSACANTAETQTESVATVAPAATEQPQLTVQEEIDAADTADELRALIETYQADGDSAGVYLAAKKLIELDPTDTQACKDAISALLETISGDCDEIESLLWQCVEASPDSADEIIRWAYEQEQTFSYDVPFVADYESEAEINTEGSTPGNLMNQTLYTEQVLPGEDLWQGGMLTFQGDWIYFSQLNGGYAIYKMRLDGSDLQRIGSVRGGDLNVIGDWLYFGNIDDRGRPYRIRTDGSLLSGPLGDECGMFSVSGDWIYYGNYAQNGVLYKSRTDGSETVPLIDGSGEIASVYDGWVYFCGENGFSRVSVDGGEVQALAGEWKADYCITDEWIYYIENSDLKEVRRMRLDGSEQSVVVRSEEIYQALNVAAGKLVVSVGNSRDEFDRSYSDKLLVIDPETGETLREIEVHTNAIYAVGDWIFYPMLDQDMAWQSLNLVTGETVDMETEPEAAETASESSDKTDAGSTCANLFMGAGDSGGGFFAVQDEWIYFGDPTEGFLCKAGFQDGSDMQVLCEDGAAFINPVGDTVYYCNMWDDYSVCSVGTDGQNQQKLADGHCEDLSCLDGWLYYYTADGIFKLPADGGEPAELLSGQFCCVYASDGWVYYIDNEVGELCRIPVEGGESESLLTDDPIRSYAIEDGGIYSLIGTGDSSSVILTKMDGSSRTTIYSQEDPIDAINVSQNRLFILCSPDDGSGSTLAIWDMETNAFERTIGALNEPVAWCFGSDVFYLTGDGVVRLNLDSGEQIILFN